MIAALALAAALLAPAGVKAGIQAEPVCLPVTAVPGHSYPLAVSVSGAGLALSVVPDTENPAARLHQVPASWVTFAASSVSGQDVFVPLTLTIPSGAAPGAYWSHVEAGTAGSAQPGQGGQAVLGAAATAGIVFTVGPSATPPPPCDALTLAQATGKFPPWPTKAFATTSWKQVFARDKGGPVTPDGGLTASAPAPDVPARPAVTYGPAASAGKGSPRVPAGWLVLIGLTFAVVAWRRKRRRS